MAATAGGYNIDNYLIPIDSTLRLYNVAGSNTNVLGVSPDAIGKIEFDGVTLTTNAQGAITINLANPNTWTATQTFATIVPSLVNLSTPTTTLTGTTTGSVIWSMPFQGSSYKKFIAYANGYENDTTTSQSITFPVAFSTVAGITYNSTGLTLTNSLTALTITGGSTTTYTGMIIIEGF